MRDVDVRVNSNPQNEGSACAHQGGSVEDASFSLLKNELTYLSWSRRLSQSRVSGHDEGHVVVDAAVGGAVGLDKGGLLQHVTLCYWASAVRGTTCIVVACAAHSLTRGREGLMRTRIR